MGIYPNGVRYRGLNRAGAEYGAEWHGWSGNNFYTFPNFPDPTKPVDLTKPADPTKLAAELTYNATRGFNVIRLPIAWERLQHSLKGHLDEIYKYKLCDFVRQATAAKFLVIIDLHNYNRYTPDIFNSAGIQIKVGEPSDEVSHVTADGPAMAWYTPYLTPNIVNV